MGQAHGMKITTSVKEGAESLSAHQDMTNGCHWPSYSLSNEPSSSRTRRKRVSAFWRATPRMNTADLCFPKPTVISQQQDLHTIKHGKPWCEHIGYRLAAMRVVQHTINYVNKSERPPRGDEINLNPGERTTSRKVYDIRKTKQLGKNTNQNIIFTQQWRLVRILAVG